MYVEVAGACALRLWHRLVGRAEGSLPGSGGLAGPGHPLTGPAGRRRRLGRFAAPVPGPAPSAWPSAFLGTLPAEQGG